MALSPTISRIPILIGVSVGMLVIFYVIREAVVTREVSTLGDHIADIRSLASTTDPFSEWAVATAALYASSTIASSTPSAISSSTRVAVTAEFIDVRVPKGVIRSEVARTPSTRERGLSGKASLGHDEGMLFIFPTPGRHSFWMKDMNFPIDIVWIASNRKIVGVAEGVTPDSYPETFIPPSNIQFVLEVPAGSAQEFGLKTGSSVSF